MDKKLMKAKIPFVCIILVITLSILSCQLPIKNTPMVITVIATLPATESPATSTPENTPSVTETPSPTDTPPPPTATATIAHTTRPETPASQGYHIWDSNSSSTAAQHRPQGGEYFDRNMFERPFSANTQDVYYPDVDIIQAYLLNDSPWIYAKIDVKGPNSTSGKLDASYGVEIDLDMNGRGDILITADTPNPTDWTTDGVRIYQDANQDVGGASPISSDPPQKGDGYESLIFDQGRGNDPDLAWARVAPNKPAEVWIAFKSTLTQNAQRYLWGVWAQNGGLHPEWFDYNDHFTLEQAGSPFPGNAQYPLKELAEVDNTCRWAVGFEPTGDEPGVCPISEAPTKEPKPGITVTAPRPLFRITPRFLPTLIPPPR
jgi:hypothetical protein